MIRRVAFKIQLMGEMTNAGEDDGGWWSGVEGARRRRRQRGAVRMKDKRAGEGLGLARAGWALRGRADSGMARVGEWGGSGSDALPLPACGLGATLLGGK